MKPGTTPASSRPGCSISERSPSHSGRTQFPGYNTAVRQSSGNKRGDTMPKDFAGGLCLGCTRLPCQPALLQTRYLFCLTFVRCSNGYNQVSCPLRTSGPHHLGTAAVGEADRSLRSLTWTCPVEVCNQARCAITIQIGQIGHRDGYLLTIESTRG
jgi:hypothetical protein